MDEAIPRLVRTGEGRVLAGVCSGLGTRTGLDPVVYRVGFGLLTVAHGEGVLLYIAAALLMPSAPDVTAPAERLLRRRFDATTVLAILGALWGAIVVTGVFGTQFSTSAISVVTLFGLALLVAHSRGVDLAELARTMPERLRGHPIVPAAAAPVELDKRPPADGGLPPGMIDLAAYSSGREPLPDEPKPAKPRSPLTPATVWTALAAGAATLPFTGDLAATRVVLVAGGVALAVVAAGLLLGGWFRARGLVLVGALLTLTLLTDAVIMQAPKGMRFGDVDWRPATVASTQQGYRMAVGSGRLDLTSLPVRAGEHVQIKAEVLMGELKLTVPRGARVNLSAYLLVGDLTVESRTVNGPRVDVRQVLEPDAAVRNPPVIDLRVRTGLGDVEVHRG
ncbi:PspC domain protein [Actinomadura rubteroloni]|uniref:PspC domain protein n=1 Tax=Actinomadura rubteroloni TaxID=1926885 RepID=A0A2P4UJN4_9ACTN|nr:PspC domain-containing protein [Actinomadura rubteroloni]POM25259.1 PspC domain protein [Actinomadura rubteroloni]